MATTTKYYRLRQRNQRISTKFQSISKGMYLTDQLMPEGFAKVLVNYDIDDTGSCVKTRKGRNLHDTIPYAGHNKLGKMHITDYVYTYTESAEDVEDIKDLIMSLGTYGFIREYVGDATIDIPDFAQVPMFISNIKITTDTNVYDGETIVEPGTITTAVSKELWALYCNKGSEDFYTIENENIGYISARTVKNAYVFDKKVTRDLGYPISTVLSNEVYAFSGNSIEGTIYTANEDRNSFTSLSKAALTKLQIRNTSNGYKIRRKVIEPRLLNPTEAKAGGYNMLSDHPYQFSDASAGSPKVLAFIPYESRNDDIPIWNLDIGGEYALRVYYQYASTGLTYKYKYEIMNAANPESDYTVITDWTAFTTGNPLWVDFQPPYELTAIRISIRKGDETNTESDLQFTFGCGPRYETPLQNREFDLTTCKGMVSWLGSIGIYGVKDAPDAIFFSATEEADYFPYPQNTLHFDNEILAVHNYLDMLLVITTDSIILVQRGATLETCTQKKVMTNIFIPEVDAINTVILKDEIFFKTDTEFYVLKPNKYTSDATDLKNFTNSTAIANYTIHFTKETLHILNRVFRPITNEESKLRRRTVRFTDFDVINIESAVKNEEVHYVYTIVPYIEEKSFGNLDLHLVYNTVTRSYRLYLVGIGDDDVSHTAKLYRNKQSGAFYEIIPYNLETDSNILIVKEALHGRDDNIIQGDWQLTPYYNNYNYFDTGNVALDDTFNKRFRELQMNVINREQSKIRFYTDVKIDGKVNVTSTRYEIQNVTDPDDPDYGLVYVIPEEVDCLNTMMIAYGDTTLEEEGLDLTKFWEVDLSKFPDLEMATIKLKLWGKGRRATFQMLCTDLKEYELSTFVWVYRIMNVR